MQMRVPSKEKILLKPHHRLKGNLLKLQCRRRGTLTLNRSKPGSCPSAVPHPGHRASCLSRGCPHRREINAPATFGSDTHTKSHTEDEKAHRRSNCRYLPRFCVYTGPPEPTEREGRWPIPSTLTHWPGQSWGNVCLVSPLQAAIPNRHHGSFMGPFS